MAQSRKEKGKQGPATRAELSAALFKAASKGDVATIKACLLAGIGVDVRMPTKLRKEFEPARQTALMVAAAKGHRLIVALLLKKGADPNAQCEYKRNALAQAVAGNHTPVVALLLKGGADPNLRLYEGDLVLRMAAVRTADLKITKLLLAHGADATAHDRHGGSALHIAAFHDRVDVAKLLIKAGADINGPRNLIGSPLACALAHRQSKMIRFLLESGIDPKRQPEALGIAAGEGFLKVVVRMLDLGFDPSSRACQGRTPLEHARRYKRRKVVDALVARSVKR